ncbi:MAG: TlpA disulfide reductase family protein [Sediminibacterium sp.]|nr:TlpA disulfide reductase family protein [Sediminibacterium sp.]
MNKYILNIIIVIFVFVACSKKNDDFTVSGKILIPSIKFVYLTQVNIEGLKLIDSVQLDKQGNFKITSTLKGENLYSLVLDNQQEILLVNDVPNIRLNIASIHKKDWEISGSYYSQQLFEIHNYYELAHKNLLNNLIKLDSIKKSATPILIKEQQINVDKLAKNIGEKSAYFIQKTSNPAVQFYVLGEALHTLSEQEVLKLTTNAINQNKNNGLLLKLSHFLQNRIEQINSQQNIAIGKIAPNFELNDLNDKPFNLQSLRGKFVLIDFWASWCAPCRAENPNIVQAFKKFKNKNFTILGVSLDKEKNSWAKAIYDDTLMWKHVSDLKMWQSIVVPLYNIDAIPFNVLIDTSGKIIATHLLGNKLDSTLEKILK